MSEFFVPFYIQINASDGLQLLPETCKLGFFQVSLKKHKAQRGFRCLSFLFRFIFR